MTDNVDHPSHYGGKDNPYETIKVIDSWGLDFCLGNAVKYISRAGKKDKDKHIEDLRKAIFYIEHEIELLEGQDMPELFKTIQNPSNEELKPCPFCGRQVKYKELKWAFSWELLIEHVYDDTILYDPCPMRFTTDVTWKDTNKKPPEIISETIIAEKKARFIEKWNRRASE